MHTIYEFIAAHGKLSEKHNKELKEKRGFSDETIAKFRFFSGGEYLLGTEAELLSRFDKDKLLLSGVVNETGSKLTLSDQLIKDNIIIPYIDAENRITLLRAHKFGFTNVPIQIYQEKNIYGKDLIITEGEFKTVATCQMGLPTIAVPGISSFSKEHFPRLVALLNKHSIRNICIIFDHEIKDNPKYPNYKDKPSDRYDTQYFAYLMAKKLGEEGFNTRIGTLPEGWMIKGKIDLDGALAQDKTKDDILQVIQASKTHKEYLEELPPEAKNIVIKKREASYFRSHVKVNFGHYEAMRKRGKAEIPETISNFTLKIIATHETQEGMMRSIVLRNELGESSHASLLSPENMSALMFKTFCFSIGNFIWEGSQDDLNAIWRHEFLHDEGKHIIEPGSVGWHEDEKMWLFGNVAIKNGKEMRPDESNIFWTDKKGYRPIPLSEDSSMPYFSNTSPALPEILEKLGLSIGIEEAKLCLGWIMSVVFMEDVFRSYKCFPFLFLTGKKGSGKSHVADWLMSFWGLERSGKQAGDSTTVGLQRCLEYYSSMPVFVDEYKNTQKITLKNGFFRSCYNRQSASKGIKSNFGVRTAKIRGTLLIAGEETPEDPALLARCIPVLITLKRRKDDPGGLRYDWFQSRSLEFSAHIIELLRNYEAKKDNFKKYLLETREYLREIGMDDRMSMNYAVPIAGYRIAFNDNDISFARWIKDEVKRVKAEQDADSVIDIFFSDLHVLKMNKKIDDKYWNVSGEIVYLYFHGLYNVWAEDYRKRKGEPPFKASSVRDYLKEEKGFIGRIDSYRFNATLVTSGIAFNINDCPDVLKNLIGDGNPTFLQNSYNKSDT